MSSELLTLRGMVTTINQRLEAIDAEKGVLKATLTGIQLICPHTSREYRGTDPRGSSKDQDHYHCPTCGKDWKE